jgi:phage shock protein C
MEIKKLYRSDTDKVFAGICGGLGEYFSIDATVLRLGWLLMVIFSGIFPGLVAYGLAIVLIPRKPHI